jgi:hypothetical protein
MAAIGNASIVNTTQQSTDATGFYIDATNGGIASGSFTAGKKYLILAMVQHSANSAVGSDIQVMHGSTAFADSRQVFAIDDLWTPYFWWTVWTAVSGEDINFQYQAVSTSMSAFLDDIIIIAINLSDNVTENTDWFYAERSTDDALTTSFLDGASITLTPGAASHDWLVLTNAQFGANAASWISRIGRSGEASSSLPEARRELNSGSTFNQASLARVFTLGASSNTFKEQAAEAATNVTRLHSRVFAIDLNKFRNHAFAYTEADTALSATNYATLLQTLPITPDVTGNVWVGGYFGFDANDAARNFEFRTHRWTIVKAVDGVDDPAGQTTDNRGGPAF